MKIYASLQGFSRAEIVVDLMGNIFGGPILDLGYCESTSMVAYKGICICG